MNLFVIQISIPIGFLTTAISVVKNLRDIQTDQKMNKHTLAVMLGERGSQAEYAILLTLACCWPIILFLTMRESMWILLPTFSLYPAIILIKKIYRVKGAELNSVLAGTALLTFLFAVLLSIGLINNSIRV